LERWTIYSRADLRQYHQERRAWLHTWAEEHGHRAVWYTAYGKYDGYTLHGVPEGWGNFLEQADQYEIYCCFVTAVGQHPLEHYLEDAAKRGEITLDETAHRPSNDQTAR
ncbi:MAG: hypothetical protein JO123_08205, partial [Ktedonobacteraceae bacterium]|nr:hypothetical protein [Ktedonobacteraceae bacterium]